MSEPVTTTFWISFGSSSSSVAGAAAGAGLWAHAGPARAPRASRLPMASVRGLRFILFSPLRQRLFNVRTLSRWGSVYKPSRDESHPGGHRIRDRGDENENAAPEGGVFAARGPGC